MTAHETVMVVLGVIGLLISSDLVPAAQHMSLLNNAPKVIKRGQLQKRPLILSIHVCYAILIPVAISVHHYTDMN